MKNFVLLLGLTIATQYELKAQQLAQFTTAAEYAVLSPATWQQEKSFSNSGFLTITNRPGNDYDYYIRKKKNTLTAGLVTLGAGLAASGIGLLVSSNSSSLDEDGTAAILFIAGAASGIASIPLMAISLGYNNKAKLALKEQQIGFGVPKSGKTITGLSISFPLGK